MRLGTLPGLSSHSHATNQTRRVSNGFPKGATVFGPAATVEEGAQLAKYWPIEIAVMDLNLNGQRADDLVIDLAGKDITVVVITGYDAKQPVIDSAFATLTKPVT